MGKKSKQRKINIAIRWGVANAAVCFAFAFFGGLDLISANSSIANYLGNGIVICIMVSLIYLLRYTYKNKII